MRQYLSLSLLVGAFAVALMALFGDDSYQRLNSLTQNIKSQQNNNSEIENKVAKLQSEIAALRFDDQELERRARKELGLARPNEIIFRFDSALEANEQDLNSNTQETIDNNQQAGKSALKLEKSKAKDSISASPGKNTQGKHSVLKNP